MGTIEDNQGISIWSRIAYLRLWLLARTRPPFHYAVEVLFQTAFYGVVLALTVLALNLFGLGLSIDFGLIGFFVGPLCVGAIAAGIVRALVPSASSVRGWLVSGTYGGVVGLFFATLIDLRWRGPTLLGSALGFVVCAAFFMLLHWLYELESRKSHAA